MEEYKEAQTIQADIPQSRPIPCEEAQRRSTRRSRSAWVPSEIESLITGVRQYGRGNWATICIKMSFSSHRTPTDLKDKWRSLSEIRPHSQLPEHLKETIRQINSEQDRRYDFVKRTAEASTAGKPDAQDKTMTEQDMREFVKRFTTDNVQELAYELLKLKDSATLQDQAQ